MLQNSLHFFWEGVRVLHVPVMRKESNHVLGQGFSSQKKLTVATMQPQSRTATACPGSQQ